MPSTAAVRMPEERPLNPSGYGQQVCAFTGLRKSRKRMPDV